MGQYFLLSHLISSAYYKPKVHPTAIYEKYRTYSDLKNKRVFISGGGSGIGDTIVEHFCEQGSEVYFVDINLKETKKLLNKIKKNKFRLPTFIECNLLDINNDNIKKNFYFSNNYQKRYPKLQPLFFFNSVGELYF